MRIGVKGNGETPMGGTYRVRPLKGEALRKLTVRPWKAIRFPEPFAASYPSKGSRSFIKHEVSLQAEASYKRRLFNIIFS